MTSMMRSASSPSRPKSGGCVKSRGVAREKGWPAPRDHRFAVRPDQTPGQRERRVGRAANHRALKKLGMPASRSAVRRVLVDGGGCSSLLTIVAHTLTGQNLPTLSRRIGNELRPGWRLLSTNAVPIGISQAFAWRGRKARPTARVPKANRPSASVEGNGTATVRRATPPKKLPDIWVKPLPAGMFDTSLW